MNHKILYLTIILGLTLASCKTTRSIIKAPLKEQGVSYLFKNLQDNELKYKSFKANFSAEIEKNKKKTSLSGIIRIKKDSLIWCRLSPVMNIEVARIAISPDSIKIINMIENSYLIQDFDYINELINRGLDFDMLQSLLIGNDFSVYDNNSFKAGIDKHEYRLSTQNRRRLRKLTKVADTLSDVIPFEQIYLDPNTFKISSVIIKEVATNNRTFLATYKNYIEVNKQLVPQLIEFNVNDGVNRIHIKLKYSKIQIDPDNQNYPFKISDKYKRVERF